MLIFGITMDKIRQNDNDNDNDRYFPYIVWSTVANYA